MDIYRITVGDGRTTEELSVGSLLHHQCDVPMPIASNMMGHASEKTTQAHYYKRSVDRRRVIGEGIPV